MYRNLTPRECFINGFDEKDFDNLMRNNIVLKMIEKSYLILSLFV